MNTAPLSADVEAAIHRALLESWSVHTQQPFDRANPSYNQCSQTAIVVYERFRGEILKTVVRTTDGEEILHFYNRIGGQRYDFTAQQFEALTYCEPLTYQDVLSDVPEARKNLQGPQLSSMKSAFEVALAKHLPSNKSPKRAREG